ncbi:MAG: FliG C-terminal domain-containing protein, partial [Candidatus Margulisiibacteriota bacterium]
MDSLEKVAILLLSMETAVPGVTTPIINLMGEDRARSVLEQVAQIGKVSSTQWTAVLSDFYDVALGKEFVFGGQDVSSKMIQDTFGVNKAKEFLKNKKDRFRFLESVSVGELIPFLRAETDQMKLIVMSHLSAKKASEVLSGLGDFSLALRLMEPLTFPNDELLDEMEVALSNYFSQQTPLHIPSGEESRQKLASIIEFLPEVERENILATYETTNPESARRVRELVFTFEDFLETQDSAFQAILFEVTDFRCLALVRLNSSPSLVEKINRCLSERTRTIVDSESIGLEKKVTQDHIEEAKRHVIDMGRKLE